LVADTKIEATLSKKATKSEGKEENLKQAQPNTHAQRASCAKRTYEGPKPTSVNINREQVQGKQTPPQNPPLLGVSFTPFLPPLFILIVKPSMAMSG